MSILRRFWPAAWMLAACAALAWRQDWNRELFLLLHQASHIVAAPLWRFASVFGDWLTVFSLMLYLSWRDPRRLPAMLIGSALAVLLAIGLKAGFAMPRPPLVLPPGSFDLLDRLPGSGSFPSGHAMAAAALATFAARGMACGRAAVWAALAGIVMLSRIAIGVHWPLDLLAGALLGWGSMAMALRWAWPQGWPRDVTRTLQLILLVTLAGGVAWLLGHRGVFAEYWLRVGIASASMLAGFWRASRLGH
ncbi:phosphatase PAP2 family protein [Chromobacterium sp. IIBBL 290-4]|uniref:phosphatase PAP2 family protein n=1 Tax=Chromobacterium sp. IIBBL 290-4 TaxID=2953890 RepID=UPI0020B87D51|nr:phosphatase PAP2 family protein [Chromobacterium sp. IIBBL 290-4]UTH72521.1 phosphatase PAP2 family protein [Chromobacterium sp. IIBBL 290-4]